MFFVLAKEFSANVCAVRRGAYGPNSMTGTRGLTAKYSDGISGSGDWLLREAGGRRKAKPGRDKLSLPFRRQIRHYPPPGHNVIK